MENVFQYKTLSVQPEHIAPDSSEIRLLPSFKSGGLCHCLLPVGAISKAVKHKTINEIWYCVSGKGIIWQKNEQGEVRQEHFSTGKSFTIPVGNCFQFKNDGDEPLNIIISTMPQWPGNDEAILVEGCW